MKSSNSWVSLPLFSKNSLRKRAQLMHNVFLFFFAAQEEDKLSSASSVSGGRMAHGPRGQRTLSTAITCVGLGVEGEVELLSEHGAVVCVDELVHTLVDHVRLHTGQQSTRQQIVIAVKYLLLYSMSPFSLSVFNNTTTTIYVYIYIHCQ